MPRAYTTLRSAAMHERAGGAIAVVSTKPYCTLPALMFRFHAWLDKPLLPYPSPTHCSIPSYQSPEGMATRYGSALI